MANFQIEVTDAAKLAAVTAAREAANSKLVPEVDGKGDAKPIETHPQYVSTDAAYMEKRIAEVVESYARQFAPKCQACGK